MPMPPIRILLQTTIEPTIDDWSIARFSRLAGLLSEQVDAAGDRRFEVIARDRGPLDGPDPILSALDESGFDQLWLFAVDDGRGLKADDCDGITRFRRAGGAMLLTRDHMDLGSSICTLGGVGAAHFFHTHNVHPDPRMNRRDDHANEAISWPNFHSGANGDYQRISPVPPLHPVLRDPDSPTGAIRYLPAHPHEGGVRAPEGMGARVIATGTSKATGRPFNIAVAFEEGVEGGRAIAQSTFHHFADYNWDVRAGCPSFVTETPGAGLAGSPEALAATRCYMLNLADWLGRRRMRVPTPGVGLAVA